MKSRPDVVDFHTHILPGIDHGCDSLQTALRQLDFAKQAGVKRIILTPHFYPHADNSEEFIERCKSAYSELISNLGETGEYPDIRLGCEVLACEGINLLPQLEMLCVSGTKTLLLELPFSDFSSRYVNDIEDLIDKGFNVILAHAERYNADNIKRLVEIGAKIQINTRTLARIFIPKAVKRWIADGTVVALGSDIHMLDKAAYNSFKRAIRRLGEKINPIAASSDEFWDASVK